MNQDNFFKACTTPAHKTLIGASAGGGKSSVVLDMVVKFLHADYRKDLECSEMNKLHSILNDQVPVVILTDENRYGLLLRLSENCLPDPDLSSLEKIERVDNLCRVFNPISPDFTAEELFNLGEFLRRHQTKLVVIDGVAGIDPRVLATWSREHNLAVVQTVQTRREAPGYSGSKVLSGPTSNLWTSDLAVVMASPIKTSSNYLKFEVTLIKNRSGMTSDKEFIYECSYAPY